MGYYQAKVDNVERSLRGVMGIYFASGTAARGVASHF